MVIDYLIVNVNCKKIVDSIMRGEKVDADYMPLILEVRRNRKKKWKGRRELKKADKDRSKRIDRNRQAII